MARHSAFEMTVKRTENGTACRSIAAQVEKRDALSGADRCDLYNYIWLLSDLGKLLNNQVIVEIPGGDAELGF